MERGLNDDADLGCRNTRDAARAWGVFLEPSHSQGKESFAPQLHGWSRNLQLFGDILTRHAVSRHGHDLWCDQERLVWRKGGVRSLPKFSLSSSGGIRPVKAEPGRPVASLAPSGVTARAMRRHANHWALECQPRNELIPDAEDVTKSEGNSEVAA